MEKVVQAWARTIQHGDVVVSSVRYGNVMYSRGSVIPLFVEKIRRGEPITVTEPTMTRFMLPLRQAVELVEFAFFNALPGDIFVRKAPAATLYDLAVAVRRIFHADNPIEVIGFRHGEKLYETLATKEELRRAEDLGDFLRLRMDPRDLNYEKYFAEGDPLEIAVDDYHSHNTRRLNADELVDLLLTLPEIRTALEEMAGRDSGRPLLDSLPPA
jgi:UDP-glucose 4-epimerase